MLQRLIEAKAILEQTKIPLGFRFVYMADTGFVRLYLGQFKGVRLGKRRLS